MDAMVPQPRLSLRPLTPLPLHLISDLMHCLWVCNSTDGPKKEGAPFTQRLKEAFLKEEAPGLDLEVKCGLVHSEMGRSL